MKIQCKHAYKIGPDYPACCLKNWVEPIVQRPRAVPAMCRADPRHYEGDDPHRQIKKCCANCDYALTGCPHPKWKCDEAALAKKNDLQIAVKVMGKLY